MKTSLHIVYNGYTKNVHFVLIQSEKKVLLSSIFIIHFGQSCQNQTLIEHSFIDSKYLFSELVALFGKFTRKLIAPTGKRGKKRP